MQLLREGEVVATLCRELTAERRWQGWLDGVGWLCKGLDAADRSMGWLEGHPLPHLPPGPVTWVSSGTPHRKPPGLPVEAQKCMLTS